VGIALAGFAVAGAGFSSIIPVVFAAGGRVSPANEAAGIATVSGIGYMGFLIGPPMIGFISEMSSLRAALGVVVALSAAAAILVGLADRRDSRGVSALAD
jgi:MFS family permease